MINLSPAFLLAAAGSFVGLREHGGNNLGPMIDLFLKECSVEPGQPWCAAFVHHVGKWSHYDHVVEKSSWPLPATASCYALGVFAKKRGVLYESPMNGDVFLQYKPELRRFGHTGIIVRVCDEGYSPAGNPWYDCDTIEGNTNDDGDRDGDGVFMKTRRLYPRIGDRFIRWMELDPRQKAADGLAAMQRVA